MARPVHSKLAAILGAMMLALIGGFAYAATNNEIFANAALRELHKLAIASSQYERAAKEGDHIGCREAFDIQQEAAHQALTNMHHVRSHRLTACQCCCGSAIKVIYQNVLVILLIRPLI
jgi:hypothetical protein